MFEIPWDLGYTFNPSLPENEIREHSDLAIESDYLTTKLNLITEVCEELGFENIFSRDLILDIDLDYFRTKKAIAPDTPSVFYHLIQHSLAVTIAEEPRFVAMERLDEDLTSDYLKGRMLQHLNIALS